MDGVDDHPGDLVLLLELGYVHPVVEDRPGRSLSVVAQGNGLEKKFSRALEFVNGYFCCRAMEDFLFVLHKTKPLGDFFICYFCRCE